MKGITPISFLPEEFIPVLLVSAGLAMILGARKIAGALILFVIISALLPTILAPILDVLPLWAVLVLGLVILLAISHEIMALFLGRKKATELLGNIIVGFVRGVLFFPFRVMRMLFSSSSTRK